MTNSMINFMTDLTLMTDDPPWLNRKYQLRDWPHDYTYDWPYGWPFDRLLDWPPDWPSVSLHDWPNLWCQGSFALLRCLYKNQRPASLASSGPRMVGWYAASKAELAPRERLPPFLLLRILKPGPKRPTRIAAQHFEAFEMERCMTNGINATMEHLMLIIWRDTWNHVVETTMPSDYVVSPSNQKTIRFKSAQRLLTFWSRWEKEI